MRNKFREFAIVLFPSLIFALGLYIGSVEKAEGVDIKFDGVSARDIYIAAALGRGETPEDAIKIADRLLRLTGPRR